MNKKIMLLPALVASLVFSQAAFSHEGGKWSALRTCMHNAVERLNLTPDQKSKIKAIKDHAKTGMVDTHKELHALRVKMRPLVDTDTLDEAKLDALIHQKKEIIARVMKNKMMVKHEMYNVLDAKQKVMFNEMAAKCDMTE